MRWEDTWSTLIPVLICIFLAWFMKNWSIYREPGDTSMATKKSKAKRSSTPPPDPPVEATPDPEPLHARVMLGKKPPRVDSRTLRLASYLGPTLPPPPDAVDWLSGITNWGMMQNDRLGDCTIAAVAHAIQVWSAATGPELTFPDSDVVDYYSQWCGYVPGDPSTDNGGVELDVLNRWRKEQFRGEVLMAFADPDPQNVLHIKQSIAMFGGVYIGLSLPLSAMDQKVWDDVGDLPGGWGGHAVYVCGYDANELTCITWGEPKRMTWNFWVKYCDEAHTLLSKMWLDRAPDDFHYGDLMSDMTRITG